MFTLTRHFEKRPIPKESSVNAVTREPAAAAIIRATKVAGGGNTSCRLHDAWENAFPWDVCGPTGPEHRSVSGAGRSVSGGSIPRLALVFFRFFNFTLSKRFHIRLQFGAWFFTLLRYSPFSLLVVSRPYVLMSSSFLCFTKGNIGPCLNTEGTTWEICETNILIAHYIAYALRFIPFSCRTGHLSSPKTFDMKKVYTTHFRTVYGNSIHVIDIQNESVDADQHICFTHFFILIIMRYEHKFDYKFTSTLRECVPFIQTSVLTTDDRLKRTSQNWSLSEIASHSPYSKYHQGSSHRGQAYESWGPLLDCSRSFSTSH